MMWLWPLTLLWQSDVGRWSWLTSPFVRDLESEIMCTEPKGEHTKASDAYPRRAWFICQALLPRLKLLGRVCARLSRSHFTNEELRQREVR